uniref:Uncharacterized protein n=1 Tax=Timema tahoe TaxID=61484 RepID=A0A7R9FKG8_9NEOP|nr:unnamed protein product [Timema tahoe]
MSLWEGERSGVASQPTKVSFRTNKNRWITETVDGASYRTGLAEKSYVWKCQFSRERLKTQECSSVTSPKVSLKSYAKNSNYGAGICDKMLSSHHRVLPQVYVATAYRLLSTWRPTRLVSGDFSPSALVVVASMDERTTKAINAFSNKERIFKGLRKCTHIIMERGRKRYSTEPREKEHMVKIRDCFATGNSVQNEDLDFHS